jgi:hypothetical protein
MRNLDAELELFHILMPTSVGIFAFIPNRFEHPLPNGLWYGDIVCPKHPLPFDDSPLDCVPVNSL